MSVFFFYVLKLKGNTKAKSFRRRHSVLLLLTIMYSDSRPSPPYTSIHTGADRPVTRDNLDEYRAMLARLRASEYIPQTDAFRAGLEAALPRRVLALLTWREMGELVCGGGSRTWRTW